MTSDEGTSGGHSLATPNPTGSCPGHSTLALGSSLLQLLGTGLGVGVRAFPRCAEEPGAVAEANDLCVGRGAF